MGDALLQTLEEFLYACGKGEPLDRNHVAWGLEPDHLGNQRGKLKVLGKKFKLQPSTLRPNPPSTSGLRDAGSDAHLCQVRVFLQREGIDVILRLWSCGVGNR